MSVREDILGRLETVLAAIDGINGFARNAPDVQPARQRPAIILQDGAEQFDDTAAGERLSRNQRMVLTPQIDLLVSTDSTNTGPLFDQFLPLIQKAVLGDAELQSIVGVSGGRGPGKLEYAGCTCRQVGPEVKETRLEVHFAFTYTFILADL